MKTKSIGLILLLFFLQSFSLKSQNVSKESENLTIFWDTSLSMLQKDITKEVELLNNYFQHKNNVSVSLISFSNEVNKTKKYEVINSNWNDLKSDLLSTDYDGSTSFSKISIDKNADRNLFFSDGNLILDDLNISKEVPTFFICSTPNQNFQLLIKKGFASKGGYVDLTADSTEEALKSLKIKVVKKIIKEKKINLNKEKIEQNGVVKGKVFNHKKMLLNAIVYLNDVKTNKLSNEKGEFTLDVMLGDILKVKYNNKFSADLEVNDFGDKEFYFTDNINLLDEVVVTSKKEQENLTSTAYGKVNKDKVGYSVKTINEKKLNASNATDITTASRGKLGSDARMGNRSNGDLASVSFDRTRGTILGNRYALIVIDGIQLKRNESGRGMGGTNKSTDFIDPANVAEITVLKGMAATNKYGSEGVNGVILITTKSSLANKGSGKKKIVNSALAKNNDYKDEGLALNKNKKAPYIDDYKDCKNAIEVYHLYLKQRVKYINDVDYYVNISNYLAQWGNKKLALKVFSNTIEKSSNNIIKLKYIAFKSEELKMLDITESIIKKIIKLKPQESQSYRDLALVHVKKKEYKKALEIYTNIFNNKYSNVNFSGLMKNINNEVSKLVKLHKNKLDISKLPSRFQNIQDFEIDARLVFDWNYSDAQFELQFVNPQKKFFKWSHTQGENSNRISQEKTAGFYSEEFLLIGVEKGEWVINVENKSDSSIKPIVLKFSIFRNYGKPNETEEIKTIMLSNLKEKQMIANIKI